MNIKTYILFIVTLLVSTISYSQGYNKYCLYSDYAVKAFQNKKFEKAISLMDSAISECPTENDNSINWYNLSLFYKSLYKENKNISLRSKILSSVLRARELDPKNELINNTNSSLKNLARLYKNDAIIILNDTSTNFDGALQSYNQYKTIMSIANPDKSFLEENIQFYNVMAQNNNIKYENNKQLYSNHLDSSVYYYEKILTLDKNSVNTYEQLGILYFNQAVDIVNNIDPEADLDVVMNTDIKKAELALKSIPYFKKALDMEPTNSQVIYSLAGCYELLSLQEEHKHYLNLLKEIDPKYYNEVYTYPSN